jgi:hypothetical protein
MTKKEFADFLSELKNLKDAEKLECTMSSEFSNVVLLSGEVFGEDTLDKIRGIGKKRGIQVMTGGLTVIYRNPRPAFRVE